MNHIISLIVGDWSGDGHDKREVINISSNLDHNAMNLAYKSGVKKLGFDFCEDVAAGYEDSLVSSEQWGLLKKAGYQNDAFEIAAQEMEEEIYLWADSFADIYLFIVKLGNENFKFEYLTEDKNPTIYIGGYGLLQ